MGTDGCPPGRFFLKGDFIDWASPSAKDCSLPGIAYGDTSSGCAGGSARGRRITNTDSCSETYVSIGLLAGPYCRWYYYDEYTTAQLITNTTAAIPAWDDDWNDTAGSYRNLTANEEQTLSIRESKYRFRFKVPKVGNGSCYKLEWVERFIPALTYDSMGAVNGGGTSITSFTVVNGGSGYTSGATVTISAPTAYGEGGAPVGGTTATGTVVVDTSPSSPTFGQITAVNVSNAGSRYTSAPSFWISGTGTGAVIHIHLGTETPKTWTWDGTPPGGYDPADSATWPLSPEYTIPVPEANGTTTVANLKTACTGCT
jgi:hypothetical protein